MAVEILHCDACGSKFCADDKGAIAMHKKCKKLAGQPKPKLVETKKTKED